MDNFPKVLCGWSWEENKMFELALAIVSEDEEDRWEIVAEMVGGEKSAEDMKKHYVFLLEDLKFIESGQLDHQIMVGDDQNCIQVDCWNDNHSLCWTNDEEDYKLLIQLKTK